MVNYMWGKDVADALRVLPLRMPVEFVGLAFDPSDPDDFDVSEADIEKGLQNLRDRLDKPQGPR